MTDADRVMAMLPKWGSHNGYGANHRVIMNATGFCYARVRKALTQNAGKIVAASGQDRAPHFWRY